MHQPLILSISSSTQTPVVSQFGDQQLGVPSGQAERVAKFVKVLRACGEELALPGGHRPTSDSAQTEFIGKHMDMVCRAISQGEWRIISLGQDRRVDTSNSHSTTAFCVFDNCLIESKKRYFSDLDGDSSTSFSIGVNRELFLSYKIDADAHRFYISDSPPPPLTTFLPRLHETLLASAIKDHSNRSETETYYVRNVIKVLAETGGQIRTGVQGPSYPTRQESAPCGVTELKAIDQLLQDLLTSDLLTCKVKTQHSGSSYGGGIHSFSAGDSISASSSWGRYITDGSDRLFFKCGDKKIEFSSGLFGSGDLFPILFRVITARISELAQIQAQELTDLAAVVTAELDAGNMTNWTRSPSIWNMESTRGGLPSENSAKLSLFPAQVNIATRHGTQIEPINRLRVMRLVLGSPSSA